MDSKTKKLSQGRRLFTRNRLLATAVSACFAANAQAVDLPAATTLLPTGWAQNSNAVFSLNPAGNLLTVTTQAQRTVLQYDQFNIAAGYGVNFIQPSSSSSVLNRVLAADPSVILGTLTSNGRVFLINPNGIYVGQGARIDVAGFVASTLNLSDVNFLANKLQFEATPGAGAVVNQGGIASASGGSVYLVATNVTNEGIISTPNGETILAAGQTVTLLDTATPGVSVEITGAAGNATNLGQIVADAGRIGIAGALVRNSGTLSASSVVNEGGRIFFKASGRAETTVTSVIAADGSKGGKVTLVADDEGAFAGTISARGGVTGGLVETSGHRVLNVAGLKVDTRAADGSAGTWLLDPVDVTIASGTATGNNNFAPSGSASTIYDGDINANLATTNVTITTSGGSGGSGNITVNGYADGTAAYINTAQASGPRSLTLNADGNLDIHSGALFYGSSTAPLTLGLTAGGNIVHAGSVNTNGGGVDLLARGSILFGDGTYSGYLQTNGGTATLVANWNGNAAVPGVAAVANCAGFYCGIGGNGSIYSYSYYGDGRAGGAVVLKAAGDIDLTQVSVYAYGSAGYSATSLAGGAGGQVTIGSTQGNLTLGYIDASGGDGGSGATGSSASANGGAGGTGGVGGSVTATAAGTIVTSNGVDVSGGYGGYGGDGYYDYSLATPAYTGTGGNGAVGGAGGSIALSGSAITQGSSGSLNAFGGNGGYGGYYATIRGAAGNGGSGGNVSLAATADIITTNISVQGGTGADGRGGLAGSVNGLTGGTGGAGGGISLNAGGVLTLTGGVNAFGGSGGYGGSAYYDYGLATPAYTGTGGAGGTGGQGGTITVAAAAAILNNAGLGSDGGNGGAGGSGSAGYGAAGMYGAGNPLLLGTSGDITLIGSNGLTGSKVSLLAGGTITFGDGTAYGYLYSGAPATLLLANWDGNGTTPGVAGVAHCGSAYCGIGGSGGLQSDGYYGYYGYYYYSGLHRNGGDLTLKAGGDIALATINVNADGMSGGYGYYYETNAAQEAGRGGAIAITSTQGGVSLGSVSARGGAGRSGNGGTGASVNGGAGGAGGAGGSVTVTAAAAIATGGSVDVAGGYGGYGGDGYYDYSLATPAYTGTGGNGGAGGAAGSIALSGSAISQGTYGALNAGGGNGGSGGYYGTARGAAGNGGAGGNVSLAATADIGANDIRVQGGYGASGQSGSAASPNGLVGGTGGAGGNVSLTAGGELTLTGGIDAVGGGGGYGGGGYYTWDATTSSYVYSGTGAAGGGGGQGGTIAVTAASIVLNNAGLATAGGRGGEGGYSGASNYGAVGARGTDNALLLGTSGGITLLGSNGVMGSKVSLLAGGAITFGDGSTGGNLYSGAPATLLLANWDGNSATPGVAGAAHCGSAYCGIGGSGELRSDNYYGYYGYDGYYYYNDRHRNGGDLTLKAAGDIALATINVNANGVSGDYYDYYYETSTNQEAGAGGAIAIASTQGGVNLGSVSARGGSGRAGNSGTATSVNGGAGGAGGAGGSVAVTAAGTVVTSNYVDVSAGSGGYGGNGYYDASLANPAYTGVGGNGGAGGAAGSITLSGSAIGQDGYGYLSATGGNGGYGGYYATTQGGAGNGGAGGTISLLATADISLNNARVHGGYGASGQGGTAASPNGLAGGTGGVGGSISLAAQGTLTLTGYLDSSGGGGGSGGSAYYDGTAYTGTGGNGGAGGNAGTLAVSAATLTLAGADLYARGGYAGWGSTYGSASGSMGAAGTDSPLILATTGDAVLSGDNYVYGSRFELLAGKRIVLGDATTAYGNLYTHGVSTTLVANWNGSSATPEVATAANYGSSAAPDVAEAANCAGAVFCGISGSGDIYTNGYNGEGYYGSGKPAGSLTIKAAGDIDLAQVTIHANGNPGYYTTALRAGGAGGDVTIASTQGSLTLGAVYAYGGYGGSGAAGTLAATTGGAGGAGGAGGNVHLSAKGALTLTDVVDTSGGDGSYGGSGYYDGTAYTGTGGNGGAGGNAGSLAVDGASLTLAAGSELYALGGMGGSGSTSGSVGGSAGADGAGNLITLSASDGIALTQAYVHTGGNVTISNSGSLTLDDDSDIYGEQGVSIAASGVSLDHGSFIETGMGASADVAMNINGGDLVLNNGSEIVAGNEVILDLGGANAQIVLNSVSGLSPSKIEAYSPMTVRIHFLARSSGGIVIDGADTTTTVDGGSGFYVYKTDSLVPASESSGLELAFGDGATPPPTDPIKQMDQIMSELTETAPPVETAEVLAAAETKETASKSSDEEEKKNKEDDSGNTEGKKENEQKPSKVGQCT